MDVHAKVVIIIVGFCNPSDIANCLFALARLQPAPDFEVFIAENGGSEALRRLIDLLTEMDGPCRDALESGPLVQSPFIIQQRSLQLSVAGSVLSSRVQVAEMSENLGYAGAINAWLRPLLQMTGWEAAWILNPDSEPTPSALAELVKYSYGRGVKMVGSRLMSELDAKVVHSRGLAWRKLVATTLAVGYQSPLDIEPNRDDVEKSLHAPSGASCFVTRDLIEHIGLMNESFFLFFEDLEWGFRARRFTRIGYAHASIVPHKGGTTTGSAGGKSAKSRLTIYLEFRNRIIFVRECYPSWLAWTVIMQFIHLFGFAAIGAWGHAKVGCQGLFAGIRGELGRPDRMLSYHMSSRVNAG